MPVTININNLTLCHKGSNGISTATIPDVCKTPAPPAPPVPIPYPNIAMSSDLMKGTTTVEADGGNMCANYGSEFFKSTGDEPGVAGGVASSTFIMEATWITFSFDVKLEGKAACRLTDKMFHNHQNTVNMGGLLQAILDFLSSLFGKSTTPSTKCCGCVMSATIQNVAPFGSTPQFLGGAWVANGHSFDFVIVMDFVAGTSGISDCTFEWWEKVNVGGIPGAPLNAWTDMFKFAPTSPTFAPWSNRTVPCPKGGSLTVTIIDVPGLGNAPGRTMNRTLEFKLTAKSGAGCTCGKTSATATATQVLVMINGVLDTSKSSFTIGPSSTTP